MITYYREKTTGDLSLIVIALTCNVQLLAFAFQSINWVLKGNHICVIMKIQYLNYDYCTKY